MKRTLVVHPFLFAVYSVLGIYSQNASQVPLNWLFRPLCILFLIAVLVYWFFNNRFRDPEYAGWVTTMVIIWLFSGHVYLLLLEGSLFWRTSLGGMLAITLFCALLGFFASTWVWGKFTNHRTVTSFLNTVALMLVIFSTWVTISTIYRSNAQVQIIKDRVAQFEVPLENTDQTHLDIYLIILDAYGREDFLRDVYNFDNSQFISFLREKGFYVADQSSSNYPQTELSISSSMNVQYLDGIVEGFGDTKDRSPLLELFQHTVIRRVMDEQGYTFVTLPSAALFAQIRDADIYYGLTPGDINEFEGLILSSTITGVLAESWGAELPIQSYRLHRNYILYSLDKLQEVPELPSPKFVFAHLLSPHPPFIFDQTGNFIAPDRPYSTWDASLFPGTPAEYQKGYIDQMIYLNDRLMDVVTTILENSINPPIIIIQGDHGPGAYYDTLKLDESCLRERYSILNAYYFPDQDYNLLYPSITPVNSFRVILNQYFGADMELLEDRNYFAGWLAPYRFTDVSDKINSDCEI